MIVTLSFSRYLLNACETALNLGLYDIQMHYNTVITFEELYNLVKFLNESLSFKKQ